MRIILLSGGSGKRLWPLSNHTRSKQFLKLLQSPTGQAESMFQRMMRQLRETGMAESITIATSAVQKEIIAHQLDNIPADVVTEPERRDTFPAIALSSAYLAMEKECGPDEVVVVVPCDPYTEKGYFDTLVKMAAAVETRRADLVLMGICPTSPSTKFGYIVPKMNARQEDVADVDRFTEKPDEEKAQLLMAEGAFWNGGVFAFRLGYLMDIVRKYVPAATFAELHARYSEFPKISFDYEVAEKAQSVAVVPYRGLWKDLGTWNSLAEELPHPYSGYVLADERTEGTCIINELNEIPIIGVGVKNMIVAASPDGILVCAKECCEYQKPLVERIDARPRYEERRWGHYKVIGDATCADGGHSITKQMHMNAGCCTSYHSHRFHEEVWTFADGEGTLVLDGETVPVKRGMAISIPAGVRHAVKAQTDMEIIVVEIGEFQEEDVERYDWNWNVPVF